MSEVRWTEEQKKVLDLRGRSILVSAAAGSGKTAVLVERIIRKVTDPVHPLDLDRLLVVTFTRAAASQMKDRIREALLAKLTEQPGNRHLQKQEMLLANANIQTIDSFCLQVVREHFAETSLDPAFRVVDDAELKLMEHEVLEEILEEHYQAEDAKFLAYVERFCPMRNDKRAEEAVLGLYHAALSDPWPVKWLRDRLAMFSEDPADASWMKVLMDLAKMRLEGIAVYSELACRIAEEADGPEIFLPVLLPERDEIARLCACETYDELAERLQAFTDKFASLSRKKGFDPEKRELVKALRDSYKEKLKDLKEDFFPASAEEIHADLQAMRGPMEGLVALTEEFFLRMQETKQERHVADFSDLEHFALEILCEPDESGSGIRPKEAAEEYRRQFEEIYIDEYQDSNLVQEYILSSISRDSTVVEGFGPSNLFMVGDVKQSIYRFRMARPKLFLDKYASYEHLVPEAEPQTDHVRVDLRSNFRSRKDAVLEPVNAVFRRLMRPEIGGILYDDDHALYGGGEYPPTEERISDSCELLLLTDAQEEAFETGLPESPVVDVLSDRELQAKVIAAKIRELTDPESGIRVYDRKAGAYRPAVCGDIAILLRTMSGWAEVFTDTLQREGIAAYADTGKGYFSAVEVRTLLSMLQVIDNPRQDIALAAVLKGMFGFTEPELAAIRIFDRESDYYGALIHFADNAPEGSCREKCRDFLALLGGLRERVPYLRVHEMIDEIFRVTGYDRYVRALPGGERRMRNLRMLSEKAVASEAGGSRGLFHFVQYIEQMHKYEMDYGEADPAGEGRDSVLILSIHKSKGLEFPIVFVAGLEKKYNLSDENAQVLVHPDYGIAPVFRDPELRIERPSPVRNALAEELRIQDFGEELRVLYVAMTRAKEKLILVGCEEKKKDKEKDKDKEKQFLPELVAAHCRGRLPAELIRSCQNYRDLLRIAAAGDAGVDLRVTRITREELLASSESEREARRVRLAQARAYIDARRGEEQGDPTLQAQIEELLRRPSETAGRQIPVRFSVSELKMADREESIYEQADAQMFETPLPRFMREDEEADEEIRGAALGTVYHKIFEVLTWTEDMTREEMDAALDAIVSQGFLSAEELAAVKPYRIWKFVSSDLAKRMARGHVHKEQPFVMGVPAEEILPGCGSSEMVMVQGIIDAFFEEEDGLVVVDYKTDRVPEHGGEDYLREKYHRQLELYAEALEKATGKPVKECIIYSVRLGETIRL
ncbi:MAG: helicase-exonuclease AddAB subunit AddA [Lachnospiraceae bacterium]|nr:helicase-exonuclease AddAB subunit AddA [Lachnospiraceae bacterium]